MRFRVPCKALSTLLRELLPHPNDGPVLIAGLGNRMITPDAIGPQTADHVIATRHLVAQSPAIFADWRPVSALAPGVLGQTGVETARSSRCARPRAPLPLSSPWMRLPPGSAVAAAAYGSAGRYRHYARGPAWETPAQRLNKETLGVPVIAVGLCLTVVDGATLAHEISSQLGQPACEALERPLSAGDDHHARH